MPVVHIDQVEVVSATESESVVQEDDAVVDVSAIHVRASKRTRSRHQANRADELKKLAAEGRLGFEPKPLSKYVIPATEEEMRPPGFKPLDGKPGDLPVPASKDDLTATFCTEAFRARGLLTDTESVTSVSLAPLGVGAGEASDNYLMTLLVDGAAPKLARVLVAKFTSSRMSAMEKAYNFSPEAHFYNDLTVEAGGLVRPNAPYVGYLAGSPGAPSRYCIIQEFCAAPAFLFKRQEGLASMPHLRLVMRSLARFHARWWGHAQEGVLDCFVHPEHLGGPFMRLPRGLTQTAQMMAWKYGLKALVHCFSDDARYAGVPKFAEEYAGFVARIRPLARRRRKSLVAELGAKRPLSLVHGDCHLENLFFGPEYEGGVAFIDFGLVSFGPPLVDVATLLGGGMPTEARRAHERELVAVYHAALGEFGVPLEGEGGEGGFSWEACWDGYTFQLVRHFFNLLLLAGHFKKERRQRTGVFAAEPSEGDLKKACWYKALNGRFAAALEDHKWHERLEALPVSAPPVCRPCC